MKADPLKFTIYVVTSPSGKRYVGITRKTVEQRWKAHCRRARLVSVTHPLVQAINKYSAKNFILDVVATTDSEAHAKLIEIEVIGIFSTTNRSWGYNISAGGDYDATTGAAAMQKRLEDPEFKKTYLAKLSAVKKAADWSDYASMTAATLQWRKDNPRLAYKIAYRNTRLMTKAQNRPFTASHEKKGTYGRLPIDSSKVLTARRSYFTGKRISAMWRDMDITARTEMSAKISKGRKNAIKDPDKRAGVLRNLAKAIAAVDRKKQGAAASLGLKNYWVRVKADPVAYKSLMERKIAKLKARANVRHPKCRAKESLFD